MFSDAHGSIILLGQKAIALFTSVALALVGRMFGFITVAVAAPIGAVSDIAIAEVGLDVVGHAADAEIDGVRGGGVNTWHGVVSYEVGVMPGG
jgi:hypothetical protein